VKRLYRLAVVLLSVQIILICLGPPRSLEDWLNLASRTPPPTPRYLVVLGAGGVPSGQTLVRCYFAAELGRQFTNITFIVALPTDGDPDTSSVGKMRDELVLRGIPADSIELEMRGVNTRRQALGVRAILGETVLTEPVLVVSSGYHSRRAVLCFRQAGFTNVTGISPAAVEADADIGFGGWIRYGVWNNAVRVIEISRELLALFVAKVS